MNRKLLRTKGRKKTDLFVALFSITIWLVYVIVWWPDQGPGRQNLRLIKQFRSFFMADISFSIACKELKIAQIA